MKILIYVCIVLSYIFIGIPSFIWATITNEKYPHGEGMVQHGYNVGEVVVEY